MAVVADASFEEAASSHMVQKRGGISFGSLVSHSHFTLHSFVFPCACMRIPRAHIHTQWGERVPVGGCRRCMVNCSAGCCLSYIFFSAHTPL